MQEMRKAQLPQNKTSLQPLRLWKKQDIKEICLAKKEGKIQKKKMTKPLLLELKKLLSNALSSDKSSLRQKLLNDAMELMSELEMDDSMAEKALKAELGNNRKEADIIINKILNVIDADEYSDEDERDFKKAYTESDED